MANQPKKYKKFVATAATATLVASAIVPVASAASLSDIAGNTHEEAINALVDAKVISGYPDGTFKPNKTLTRSDVVKLLGKYLVSQGHSIPTDAVSNPRFNDLTSKSNKELLEYAAVVADAGVFAGSNGKLLAGDQITRENMAIVLVRMINTLKDVSLEEFVASQNFNGDVKDLNVAKAEARTAIQVLDFYDITNPSVANFNPKGNTTRGQFATFLHKTINSDFSGAAATTGTVKAINNTTVEVTFGEEVGEVKASDFKIEGLEVKNAVVKQTDKKTVVLTTAAQKAGTEYTVTVNGDTVGKFTGVSAVIPTAIDVVQKSVQGKLGQEVTLSAQVTVAEGASKAGIPVTFNVPGSTDNSIAPITVETVTNADGVATYAYTRYTAINDTVTAYATGDRSKFSTGFVFWGVDTILAVEEVTEGDTIANGANKTYKVTYKSPSTGKVVPNALLKVSFKENIDVAVDKASKAKVNGTNPVQYSNGSATDAVEIYTDSNGVATFTVSGENTEVTPIVWVPATATQERYSSSILQVAAKKVTFGATQAQYKLELTREGAETAAIGASNGRLYKVVVKDKDGNVAKNEIVNLGFNEILDGVISTQAPASAQFAKDTNGDGRIDSWSSVNANTTVKTNSKGEAEFYIVSTTNNDYATPIAWIDVNTANAANGTLEKGEPSIVGPISYFTTAKLTAGKLVSKDANGNSKTQFVGSEPAKFEFSLTNQSGRSIAIGDTPYDTIDVTFTVKNTGSNDVEVNGQTVSPNRYTTVSVNNAAPFITVKPIGDKSASVEVTASAVAYDNAASNAERPFTIATTSAATATFTSTTSVADTYVGFISSINTSDEEVTFEGKSALSYGKASFKENNTTITKEEFERIIKTYANVRVSYVKDTDGNVTFTILEKGTADTTAPTIASATYTAAAGVVAEKKSSVIISQDADIATLADQITVTSTAVGTAGDGFTINIVDEVDGSAATTAVYSSATKTLTVELKDAAGAGAPTATLQEVVDAINAEKAVTNLEATLDATAVATLAVADSGVTAGGVNASAAIADSTLVITFSEAIEESTLDAATEITIKDTTLATTRTLGTGATFTLDATGKKLTIKLGSGADVVATDKITASTATDLAGNAVDLSTPKAIN